MVSVVIGIWIYIKIPALINYHEQYRIWMKRGPVLFHLRGSYQSPTLKTRGGKHYRILIKPINIDRHKKSMKISKGKHRILRADISQNQIWNISVLSKVLSIIMFVFWHVTFLTLYVLWIICYFSYLCTSIMNWRFINSRIKNTSL